MAGTVIAELRRFLETYIEGEPERSGFQAASARTDARWMP